MVRIKITLWTPVKVIVHQWNQCLQQLKDDHETVVLWLPDCWTQPHLLGSMASLTDLDVGQGRLAWLGISLVIHIDIFFGSWWQNISKLGASRAQGSALCFVIIQHHIRFLSCVLCFFMISPKTSLKARP